MKDTLGTTNDLAGGLPNSLLDAWSRYDVLNFNDWIIEFSDTYFRSGLDLKQSARLIGARPAEVQAALDLASLSEEELQIFSNLKPARTTWFLLSAASHDALSAAAAALGRVQDQKEKPFEIVSKAIRESSGPSALEKVASLSSDAFKYAADAADAYGLLNDKSRNALRNFARAKRTGKSISMQQAAYALDLIQQLLQAGSLSNNASDGHQELSSELLAAIGQP